MKIVLLTAILSICCGGESPGAQIENDAQVRSFVAVNSKVEQGGTLVFQVSPPATSNPTIFIFGEHYKPNARGTVFIGIGLDTEPGKYVATFNENGLRSGWDYEEIEVLSGSFEKTRISRYTGRPIPRTDRQKKAIDKVFVDAMDSDGSVDRTGGLGYVDPLCFARDVIDSFGFIYKNNPYRKHEGVDLRSPVGMPVKAANAGKVIMTARNFRAEGNMLILSHGLGIFSVYMHLSKFEVGLGDTVKRGQPVALSGRTGVGIKKGEEHLHFSMKIRSSYVDPLNFITTVNQYLE